MSWRAALIRAICLPGDMFGLLLVLFLHWLGVCEGLSGRWHGKRDGCLVWIPHRESWVASKLQFSVTFGHVVLLHPEHVPVDVRMTLAEYNSGSVPESGPHRRVFVYDNTGDLVFYVGGGGSDIWAHEQRHVHQFEALSFLWALATLLSWSGAMVALWPLAWPGLVLAASAASWLRGGHYYFDNVLEQHARGNLE